MLYKMNGDSRLQSLLVTISLFIEENAKLRQMLAQLSSFVGDSGGGVLASRGINLEEIRAASLVNDREWIFNKAEEVTNAALDVEAKQVKGKGKAKQPEAPAFRTPNDNASARSEPSAQVGVAKQASLPVPDIQASASANGGSPNTSDGVQDARSPDLFAQLFQSSGLFPPPGFETMVASATPVPSGSSGHSSTNPLDFPAYGASSWPTYQAVPVATSPVPAASTLSGQASQLIN